jgi:LysR family transcriptional regulator, low CO2-responsive transcriptional regulator
MAITLTQLNSFLAIVRTGSVTAAAEELVVTQPSVSAALSALSKEVGLELTERDGRSLRLSPAGETYARYAADVVGLLDQGARAAHEAADAAARELRIAAVNTAGEYLVSPLVHAFQLRHPGVEITLDVGNRQRVFQLVADHRADVAIGGRPPNDERLVGTPFLPNEIVLVTAPDDPLAGRRSVPVRELASRHWLLREQGSGTRTMIDEFLARHDLRPRILTLGSNGAIKQAAAIGLGVSLQSRLAVELELQSGVLATIGTREPLPERDWYVLRAAVGPERPLVREFVDFVTGDEGREALEAAGHVPAPAPRRRAKLAAG